MRFTEQELKAYAEMKAETIVIRTFNNGNSSDDIRDTTPSEKQILTSIIYGGLLAIRYGAQKQSVLDACEYIGNIQVEELIKNGRMNGYDSVYMPISQFPEMI